MEASVNTGTVTINGQPSPAAELATRLVMMSLALITPSRTNPGGRTDAPSIKDLVESVRTHGVLQPVLVRPLPGLSGAAGPTHELVTGHRRYAAAKAVGLTYLPVTIRELADAEALEIQIIENLERADMHPLDEAEAYARLRDVHKQDVARIAERVGRSIPYVYDRLRLNGLATEVKKLFRSGEILPGHAIVLARLQPAEQLRAMKSEGGGLFEYEHLLFGPAEDYTAGDDEPSLKLRSVRELQGWIDTHVKLDVKASDLPQLFPDLHQVVSSAKEQALKVVHITHEHRIAEDARDGEKVIGPRSWVRADGKAGSKQCDRSVIGVVVVGPGRGESMRVCYDRGCVTHFGKAKPARAAGKASSSAQAEKTAATDRARRIAAEVARMRWETATSTILQALAKKLAVLPVSPKGVIWERVLSETTEREHEWDPTTLLPPGKTPESLMRHLALVSFGSEATSWRAQEDFPNTAKALGLDIAKILEQVCPKGKPVAGVCTGCGKSNLNNWEKPKWANPEETICSECAPKALAKPEVKKPHAKAKRDGKCAECGTRASSAWSRMRRTPTGPLVDLCADCAKKPAAKAKRSRK